MSIRIENPSSSGGGSGFIPEYTSDPVAPATQTAWVLKTETAPIVNGGGALRGILGLATYYITAGTTTAGSLSYQFSYRTLENTTKRVVIS